uniref:phosphoethanolamine N-methyltransferase n=1 Tax=Romanomermis culicivorax TaxID=13658 RepID=A0A915J674_ROMCU
MLTQTVKVDIFSKTEIEMAELKTSLGEDFQHLRASRFTPILAARAQHVIAADIVESFIEVNRKNNQHLGNVSFQTGEASEMKVDANSIDLLFTNWLLMYLTDAEVIHLLKNALHWLSDGGYMHIRESCSEPSKRTALVMTNTPTGVYQVDSNPTHYRHICQYLNLLKSINLYDESTEMGHQFVIVWSKSVDTYIEAYGNWRQVQILVRKVSVAQSKNKLTSSPNDERHLSMVIKSETIAEQVKFDLRRETMRKFFHERIADLHCQINSILHLVLEDRLNVDAFELSEAFDCSIHSIETNPYSFNANLSRAVEKQDKRVRFYYAENIDGSMGESWLPLKLNFDLIVGCRLLENSQNFEEFFANLKEHMNSTCKLLSLEAADNEEVLEEALFKFGFTKIKIKEVTLEIMDEASVWIDILAEHLPKLSLFYQSLAESDKLWFTVVAE